MRLGTVYRYELLSRFGLFKLVRPEHRVLDIGGYDGFILSTLDCRERVLVDPDARKDYPGVNYVRDDFLGYEFSSGDFDFIFTFDVIEHIPDGEETEFAQRIARLLKPGGTCYLTAPSRDIRVFPWFLTGWVSRKWGHDKCPGFTRAELGRFISPSGLGCVFTELNAPSYRFWYLFLRALQPALPRRLTHRLLGRVAAFDAVHHRGTRGYFLLALTRPQAG